MSNLLQICPKKVTSISVTIIENLKLFDKSNQTNVFKLEVTTHSPIFKHWSSFVQKITIGMLKVVLRGNNLENKLGLVFGSNLHSNHLQMTKCYLHLKEGQETFSNHLTNMKTIILRYYGKLWNVRQHCHNYTPSTWIYTHQHISNFNFQRRMFGICCVWVSCKFSNRLGIICTLTKKKHV